MSNHTYAEIWQTLSEIDVSKRLEKKNGLSYLSWAWAWGILMENYPDATYEFLQPETHMNGTMTVYCQVSINKTTRLMWLPVMDYKNKAIPNPDATAINKAKMRCLVKCLALFGLGHYIYAGEDTIFPEPEPIKRITQEQAVTLYDALIDSDTNLEKHLKRLIRLLTPRDYNLVFDEIPQKPITQEQIDILSNALEESDSDIEKFLNLFKKQTLDELTEPEYIRALQMIEMKQEKANASI